MLLSKSLRGGPCQCHTCTSWKFECTMELHVIMLCCFRLRCEDLCSTHKQCRFSLRACLFFPLWPNLVPSVVSVCRLARHSPVIDEDRNWIESPLLVHHKILHLMLLEMLLKCDCRSWYSENRKTDTIWVKVILQRNNIHSLRINICSVIFVVLYFYSHLHAPCVCKWLCLSNRWRRNKIFVKNTCCFKLLSSPS